MAYRRRIMDDVLDELFPHLAAIALEGANGVGKTATASRRAATVLDLADPNHGEASPQATTSLRSLRHRSSSTSGSWSRPSGIGSAERSTTTPGADDSSWPALAASLQESGSTPAPDGSSASRCGH